MSDDAPRIDRPLVAWVQLPMRREEAALMINAANLGICVITGDTENEAKLRPATVKPLAVLGIDGWDALMERVAALMNTAFDGGTMAPIEEQDTETTEADGGDSTGGVQ